MIGFQHRVMIGLGVLGILAPFVVYPIFLMKALCFALFAAAFNLALDFDFIEQAERQGAPKHME